MTALHTAAANVLARAGVLETVGGYLLNSDDDAAVVLPMLRDLRDLTLACRELHTAMRQIEREVGDKGGCDAQVSGKRDSPIVWGNWDDNGPYLVLAEGRTIAEAAQVVDESTCAKDGGVRAVPLDGPQPRRATVHDCEHDEIGRCKDPQCHHGHEETVYVFELEDEDEVSFAHYWTLSRYTSPSGKLMYHCPVCGLYDPAPVKTQYERRPCKPGAYEGCWTVADGVVRVVLNPDTQTAGIPDKPRVWRLHGADNMRMDSELVKTFNEAVREGER